VSENNLNLGPTVQPSTLRDAFITSVQGKAAPKWDLHASMFKRLHNIRRGGGGGGGKNTNFFGWVDIEFNNNPGLFN
jgi:hypothetical protein